jgi:hypothetical protein
VKKLREVDLAKTTVRGSKELKVGPWYLVQIGGQLYAGKFSMQWYGLNFGGWSPNPAGLQYDPPGTNSSLFEKAWLIYDA